jgi:plasmid stability protein
MAQLLVRNLDDSLKERLRVVAASHGRSMEEEARVILHTALAAEVVPRSEEVRATLSERIHALLVDVEFPEEYFTAVEEARRGNQFIDVRPRAIDVPE